MCGFAVEVVLARHCNSTRPRLHDRQNAWKAIHVPFRSGGHIQPMRGFAVEVVLARHCNSTCPRLHDRQNASENNTFFILFWRSHSLHARFCC